MTSFAIKRAVELYHEADRLDDQADTLDKAERLYLDAIRLNPSMSEAFTNLGNVLHQKGDTDGAIQQYEEALRLDPRQPEATFNLGIVYHDEGDIHRAIGFFNLALVLCACPLLTADIHYRLAVSYDEIGDIEKSRPHWQRLIELEPKGECADYARKWLEETSPRKLTVIRGGK